MLKACWDCVAGSGVLRNGGENDGSYGIQLNGDSQRAPLRPARSEERNMYTLPRNLRVGDHVVVSGNLHNADKFTIDFLTGENIPDYNNIACQLETNIDPSTGSANKFTIRIIYEGATKVIHENYLKLAANGSTFKIRFEFKDYNGIEMIDTYIGESRLHTFEIDHEINSMSFLKISEDFQITSLLFEYS